MTRTDTLENFAEDLKAAAINRGAEDPGLINPKYLDELITSVPILVDYGPLPVHISPLYTEQDGVGKIRLVFTNPPNSVGGKILMTEDGELPNLNSLILTQFEAAPNERKTFVIDELEPAKKYGFWALPKNASEFYQTASDVRTKQMQDTVNYDPNSRIVELDLPGELVSTATNVIIKITQDGKVFLSSSSIAGIWKLEEDMTWTKVHSIGRWTVWYETSELFITSSIYDVNNRGILVWNEDTQTFTQTISSTTPYNFINWFKSTDGKIFTSAQSAGIWEWNTTTRIFDIVLNIGLEYATWFEDSEGNIYSSVTNSPNGIYIYNPITSLFEIFITNAYINSTFITSSGRNFMLIINNVFGANSVLYEISGAIATDAFPDITTDYTIRWWHETMSGEVFFNSTTDIFRLNISSFELKLILSYNTSNPWESELGFFFISYFNTDRVNVITYYWDGSDFIAQDIDRSVVLFYESKENEIYALIALSGGGSGYTQNKLWLFNGTAFVPLITAYDSWSCSDVVLETKDDTVYFNNGISAPFSGGGGGIYFKNKNIPPILTINVGSNYNGVELVNRDIYFYQIDKYVSRARGIWKKEKDINVSTRVVVDTTNILRKFLCATSDSQKVFFNNITNFTIEMYDQSTFTIVLSQNIPADSEIIEETDRFVVIPTNNTPYVYIDKTTGEITTDPVRTGGVIYKSNHEIYTIDNSTNKLNNKDEAERDLMNIYINAPVIEHDVYAVSRNNTTASILITVGDEL